MHRSVTCLLLCAILVQTHGSKDVVVSTSSGSIQGFQQEVLGKRINTFLGIPYAKPPVGPLRFKWPQPVSPWDGILRTTKKPVPCPQDCKGDPSEWVDPGEDASEDCLFLSVWAPNDGEQKKAVMFFIHGGGLYKGSSRLEMYDGKAMAALGDVVVVTINYRLGVMGFLHLGDEDCPGNQGLADQNMALKWVHDNAATFGGDPSRITVFGESAGSISTGLHLMSPLSRPYVRRAILQSCTPNLKDFSLNLEDSLKVAKDIAVRAGCWELDVHAVIECLRNRDVHRLLKIVTEMAKSMPVVPMLTLPTHGEEILPIDPAGALKPGDIKQAEIMVGVNENEGDCFISMWNSHLFDWEAAHISIEEGEANLTEAGTNLRGLHQCPKVKNFYLKENSQDIRVALSNVIGDYMIVCPAVFFSEQFSNMGGDVYFYNFHHRPSTSKRPAWTGSTHFDEIQFVFGMPLLKWKAYTKEEEALAEEMIKIWTTFAKTGSPPAFGEAHWPKYTANRPVLVDITAQGMTEIIGPRIEFCNFWRCNPERIRASSEGCDVNDGSCASST